MRYFFHSLWQRERVCVLYVCVCYVCVCALCMRVCYVCVSACVGVCVRPFDCKDLRHNNLWNDEMISCVFTRRDEHEHQMKGANPKGGLA